MPELPTTLAATPGEAWESLAEGNEAGAYASLAERARMPGFGLHRQAAAVALHSPAAASVLVVNRVIGWGAGHEVDESSLDRLVALYGDAGFGIELCAGMCTAEVLAWLKARHFRRLSTSQVMVCDTAAASAAGRYETWARSTGLRVESVDAEQAATLARLCCENFNMPEVLGEWLRAGMLGEGWRRWLAFDGDQAVGASLSYVQGSLCWFGWSAVNPSHRGRWIQAGFVARQLEDAAEAGCRWITTDTAQSAKERPNPVHLTLKRFGFVDAYLRPTFVRAPVRRA